MLGRSRSSSAQLAPHPAPGCGVVPALVEFTVCLPGTAGGCDGPSRWASRPCRRATGTGVISHPSCASGSRQLDPAARRRPTYVRTAHGFHWSPTFPGRVATPFAFRDRASTPIPSPSTHHCPCLPTMPTRCSPHARSRHSTGACRSVPAHPGGCRHRTQPTRECPPHSPTPGPAPACASHKAHGCALARQQPAPHGAMGHAREGGRRGPSVPPRGRYRSTGDGHGFTYMPHGRGEMAVRRGHGTRQPPPAPHPSPGGCGSARQAPHARRRRPKSPSSCSCHRGVPRAQHGHSRHTRRGGGGSSPLRGAATSPWSSSCAHTAPTGDGATARPSAPPLPSPQNRH